MQTISACRRLTDHRRERTVRSNCTLGVFHSCPWWCYDDDDDDVIRSATDQRLLLQRQQCDAALRATVTSRLSPGVHHSLPRDEEFDSRCVFLSVKK